MTAVVTSDCSRDGPHRGRRRIVLYVFLIGDGPDLAVPARCGRSTRRYVRIDDDLQHGYVSLPRTLNLDNFVTAWNLPRFPTYFLNTLIVHPPAWSSSLWLVLDDRRSRSRGSAGGSTCSS